MDSESIIRRTGD